MQFRMTMIDFPETGEETFTENTAPKWLCEGGRKDSTMDNRWFWDEFVLTLKVGEYIDTDFRRIERIK